MQCLPTASALALDVALDVALDAAVTPDATPNPPPDAVADAAPEAGNPNVAQDSGGCGCTAPGRTGGGRTALLAMALALAALGRRARRGVRATTGR